MNNLFLSNSLASSSWKHYTQARIRPQAVVKTLTYGTDFIHTFAQMPFLKSHQIPSHSQQNSLTYEQKTKGGAYIPHHDLFGFLRPILGDFAYYRPKPFLALDCIHIKYRPNNITIPNFLLLGLLDLEIPGGGRISSPPPFR